MSQDSPATRADFAAVAEDVRALTRTVAAALSDSRTHSGGRAEIHFSAGSLGLWVAVTCCVVCIAAVLAGVVMYVNLDRKMDRLTDYQTATYMIAPHLKPKDPAK